MVAPVTTPCTAGRAVAPTCCAAGRVTTGCMAASAMMCWRAVPARTGSGVGPVMTFASYRTSAAGVEVLLHDGTARGGDAEGDRFVGTEIIEYVDTG